ncbi:MAG: diguanylate cyclase [Defluviitaleaceae bacterium]|nr:diguanylate cyclase [Defluviitaleaceae bacterium]
MYSKKNTILITDDSAFNLDTLTHILQDEYTLYTATDGCKCLEIARTKVPDLILLDIVMPQMCGIETIAALKENSLTADIPVIFITGLTQAEDEERGFTLGASDYINKPFSSAVVKLRVRNQIQIVNQIRQIHRNSITDELTGIGNRRFFYDQLEQEWARAIRSQKPLSFMMIDIDNFKLYNDTNGHIQGDYALRSAAQTIKASLARATDICARWGGEEFVVILPETDLAGARAVAERIRSNIEKLELPLPDGTVTHITISIGINTVIPDKGNEYPLNKFVSDTDNTLYCAKTSGRNRACAFADLPPKTTQ